MNTVTGRLIYLQNVDYATIDNLDLGYAITTRTAEGIRADSNSDFLTIKNTNLANRTTGLVMNGGRDLTLTNDNFSNNSQALDLNSLTKQFAASAIIASGNNFTNSSNAIRINTLTGTNAGLGQHQ